MKEFISIFIETHRDYPRETRAIVTQTIVTFFVMCAAFIVFIYLFA